jgi:quinate/shikimate dehydrogenase (NAD+)
MQRATDASNQIATGEYGRRPVVAGLVGRGIQLSRTPAMHVAEGSALGLRYEYHLIDTELMERDPGIGALIADAEKNGFSGLNITYPYKIDVIDHLHELSDAARTVGAVNTVVFREGRRFGHNTDVWGFAESFRRQMSDVVRHRVLLIGAGGAGVAVAQALMQNGTAHLVVHDSEPGKAHALAANLAERFGDGCAVAAASLAAAGRLDGVVNATPVGMKKIPGTPFPVDRLDPSMWVADIIYFPIETELLRAARKAGCRTMPGSGMALFQAVRAFELITGLVPDSTRMKATFDVFDPTAA